MKGLKISVCIFIPLVICTILLLILCASLFENSNGSKKFPFNLKQKVHSYRMENEKFWQNNDFSKGNPPDNLKVLQSKVDVQSKTVSVLNTDIFYRTGLAVEGVSSSGQDVILLHGQRFSSKSWLDLGTIQFLTACGHNVAAIDLPGFGQSTHFNGDKGNFLKILISNLGLKDVILVSPSYSGSYTVPFIESYGKEVAGYFPIAAVNCESFKKSGSQIKVPTLNIIGELDSTPFGLATKDYISNIATSQSVIIPRGSHSPYLDNPELFHTLLYNFIKAVKKSEV